MARPAIKAPASEGICSFCQSKIDKSQMTRHLKACKERKSAIEKEGATSSETAVRMFHILVEGQYNPQYWMHLELPASEELDTLDAFLRSIWLECCGHLSSFRIDGTSYETESEQFVSVEEGGEGEDEYQELTGNPIIDFGKVLDEMSLFQIRLQLGLGPQFPAEWLAEIRKPRTIDEFVLFAKEELKAIPKGGLYSKNTPEALAEYDRLYEQRSLLESLLLRFEDCSLYVPLQRVLKVGQKFSHEYDFGSTTHLNLKVMAEREGHILKEDDPVTVLARNVAPAFVCQVCGKPATQVASGGYYDMEDEAYCNECAKKKRVDTLPIVNSPRVGVCGYTGDAEWSGEEGWGSEGEWDEEEENED